MIMVTEVNEYLLGFAGAWRDYPFGEKIAVYKYGRDSEGKGKMFAIVHEESKPLRISLKCDPQLAETLREQYEEVQPGYHLNKKHWNTIINTGQLSDDELRDLARHSYQLVSGQQ